MTQSVLGIIGGSGLYDIPALQNVHWQAIQSPWGEPSDRVLFADLDGLPVRFLPRHGRGHRIPPSAIDFRANIDVLKRAGVTDRFVVVDQFIDRTFARAKSFFGPGCVAHISMADPVSPLLATAVEQAAAAEGIAVTRGGTYLVMEGPQFSTRAESELYRSWGCSVIGMTNMPEAKLAREAEICYATLAMVTDYDCWHDDHGAVDVAAVIKVLSENVDKAHRLIERLARAFPREHPPCPIGSDRALDVAIITPPEARDPALLAKLDAVAGRVL
jgi:5'-methylthioadenosine phosphorylase